MKAFMFLISLTLATSAFAEPTGGLLCEFEYYKITFDKGTGQVKFIQDWLDDGGVTVIEEKAELREVTGKPYQWVLYRTGNREILMTINPIETEMGSTVYSWQGEFDGDVLGCQFN